MTKKIANYKELLEEKERLQLLLNNQKEILRADVKGIKEEFEPVRAVVGYIKKFTRKDSSNPMLNIATGRIINLILRRVVLAKAGWFTKLAVPFLAKNFTTNVIADNKTVILGKIATWINKVRGHKVNKPAVRTSEY